MKLLQRSRPFVTSAGISGKIRSTGEFGNQLFQIAAVLGYAEKYDVSPLFEPWICPRSRREYFKLFPYLDYKKRLLPKNHYLQPSFGYSQIPFLSNVNLEGGFHSPFYFPKKLDLKKVFLAPDFYLLKIDQFLRKNNIKEYAALHMRFYDRPQIDSDNRSLILNLSTQYYIDALSRCTIEPIIIVSDNAFRAEKFATTYLKKRQFLVVSSDDSLFDFFLITNALQIIISNSSFSWWAAYLNSKDARVIAPHHTKWFTFFGHINNYYKRTLDIYPDFFEQIDF